MDSDNIKKLLSIKMIEEKIFKIKDRYHPSLIMNLSKEAYDIYLIRNSICDLLLELLKERDLDVSKVNIFIEKKIGENKKRLKEAKNAEEAEIIKVTIKEWEQFL
ncbi:MAG: hypothetical protein ACFE8E_11830 [Candidatus Hodarchaeota archaeon]